MGSTDGIENVLSLGEVRYVVVRPHRGMRGGYEVINAWNENRMAEFAEGDREQAIEYARGQVARSRSFDSVLAVFPEADDDDSADE